MATIERLGKTLNLNPRSGIGSAKKSRDDSDKSAAVRKICKICLQLADAEASPVSGYGYARSRVKLGVRQSRKASASVAGGRGRAAQRARCPRKMRKLQLVSY